MKTAEHTQVNAPVVVTQGGYSYNPMELLQKKEAGVNPFLKLQSPAITENPLSVFQRMKRTGNSTGKDGDQKRARSDADASSNSKNSGEADVVEVNESDSEEEEEEEWQPELLDPTRQLELINFTHDGIKVLTESFNYSGQARRRPVEWKVAFSKWSEGAHDTGPTTPTPLSLYQFRDGYYHPDKKFDEAGKYQKGHMVPRSSGALNHFALTTPMEQYTNQQGTWKKTEEAIDRILLKGNKGDQTFFPRKDKEGYGEAPEQTLALTIKGYYSNAKEGHSGFVHIEAKYKGDDPRIPSSYVVGLYGSDPEEDLLLFQFPEILNEYAADKDKMPSQGLKDVFQMVQDKLKVLDAETALKARLQGNVTNTEWSPLAPKGIHPPTGIPEQHVPRPHRALDLLVQELRSLPADKYLAVLATLSEEEKQVVDAVVKENFAPASFFTAEQRDLAERHARFLDPEKKDRFLSDTRKAKMDELYPEPKEDKDKDLTKEGLRYIYFDQIDELKRGGGVARPEADHHVPRQTGMGTNLFSNLLWVSHQQNMSKKAQNKPVAITNPNREGGSGIVNFNEKTDKEKEPGWGMPGRQKYDTVAKGHFSEGKMDSTLWAAWQSKLDVYEARQDKLEEWARLSKDAWMDSIAEKYEKTIPFINREQYAKEKAALVDPMPWEIEKIIGRLRAKSKHGFYK